MDFVIRQWSAWADGLSLAADWRAWACSAVPVAPPPGAGPALAQVPALARRRLNRLGRMALQVLHEVRGSAALDLPVVLASRYGDTERALGELAAMARGEAVSPAAFGLSVHNAIGATGAIIDGCRANMIALAAGEHTAVAGVVEALGLLHDGAPEVLLLCYDEELPSDYARFSDVPIGAWAWAWRLALPTTADTGSLRVRLQRSARTTEPGAALTLPEGLAVLRFVLDQRAAVWRCGGWQWERGPSAVETGDAVLA